MARKLLIASILVLVTISTYVAFQDFRQKGGRFQEQAQETCPSPLTIMLPVNIERVTSVLYPGQVRGGDFKPHGGFRFDSSKSNDTVVVAPFDAVLSDASRYLESGQVQYLFDFQTNCGIRYRFDHLLVLAPKFSEIVASLPEAKENDSRTTRINQEIFVQQGEVIATAVGVPNNVFVDFGVYAVQDEQDAYNLRQTGMCWFDILSSTDAESIKSLPPGSSESGGQSEYCR